MATENNQQPTVPPMPSGPLKIADVNAHIDAIPEETFLERLADLAYESRDAFEYQGFDPIKLKAAFKLKFPGKEWCKVLYLTIATLCIRGSNLKKILNRSSDELKSSWDKYRANFKSNANGKYSASDFTLPRVAACFPIESAKVANKINNCLVPEMSLLPKLITSNMFAAVCPTKCDTDDLAMLARFNLIYLMKFDQAIRPRKPRAHHATIANFFNIARSNKMCTDEERKKLIHDLGLIALCKAALTTDAGLKELFEKELVAPFDNYTEVSTLHQVAIRVQAETMSFR
uniref:Saliva protein-14 n=1 Tax=Tetranychus truncatus TaxID=93132 RepID=A0A3G5AQU2_9ACAR|nr:saliva protein-14 [Tetranychus truncatus]